MDISKAARNPTTMTKKKEIELARKFFDLIFREVENGEDVIYDFIDPECRYKTLCDKLNNETVKEVLELGFKQKYGEEWHGGKGEQDNVDPLYDAKAVGNAAEAMAKFREAYEFAEEFLRDYGTDWKLHNKLCDMLKSALAAPPRQCDVGTAEGQVKRFTIFCKSQRLHSPGHADFCNPKCPCRDGGDINLCALTWAQMPYEEGDLK